jgi:hypothetical protein
LDQPIDPLVHWNNKLLLGQSNQIAGAGQVEVLPPFRCIYWSYRQTKYSIWIIIYEIHIEISPSSCF